MSSQNIVNMDEERLHYNFSQICRFCLSQGGVMTTIFDDGSDTQVSIPSKILACLSIQVYVGDGLPALICQHCLQQLERSYQFRKQCEQSEATLRQYRNKSLNKDGAHQRATQEEKMKQDSCSEGSQSPHTYNRKRKEDNDNPVYWSNSSSLDNSKSSPSEPLVVNIDPYLVKIDSSGPRASSSHAPSNASGVSNPPVDFLVDVKPDPDAPSGVGVEITPYPTFPFFMKPHICTVCGKRFARKDKLTRHSKIHGQINYPCGLCPAVFQRKDELDQHSLCHTGERPWCCDVCFKSFLNENELRKHALSHSTEKPFKCSICSASFNRKDKLTRHEHIHNGLKPYVCHICSYKFSRRDKLKRHMTTHIRYTDESLLQQHPCLIPPEMSGGMFSSKICKKEEDGSELSLSRLGQNPEIVLLPIQHQ